MTLPHTRKPAGGPAFENARTSLSISDDTAKFHAEQADAQVLLQRLDGVVRSGKGWRAKCPSCGGASRKVSIAEADGRVLLHCFGGCKPTEVLQAIGLTWADLQPPRHWPLSPGERRQARRAIRESGWASALSVLALEATVVRIASAQISRWQVLTADDDARLEQAAQRIHHAAAVLVESSR